MQRQHPVFLTLMFMILVDKICLLILILALKVRHVELHWLC